MFHHLSFYKHQELVKVFFFSFLQTFSAKRTRLYSSEHVYAVPKAPRFNSPTVAQVREADCIEVALELKQQRLNPAVLNMASMSCPGGK